MKYEDENHREDTCSALSPAACLRRLGHFAWRHTAVLSGLRGAGRNAGVESSDRPPSLLLTHPPKVQDGLMACLPPCSPGPRKMHESIPDNKCCEGPDVVVFHHGSTSFVYVEVTAHTAPMSCLCMNQHHLPTDLYTLIPGICSHVRIRTPRLTLIPSARDTEKWKRVQTSQFLEVDLR